VNFFFEKSLRFLILLVSRFTWHTRSVIRALSKI